MINDSQLDTIFDWPYFNADGQLERIVEEGEVFTDRMARYRIPSIVHTPEITSIVVEHPTGEGTYGAKGVGEIVSIPTTPAITNAIYNAVGVRIDSLPVDQEVIVAELARKAI